MHIYCLIHPYKHATSKRLCLMYVSGQHNWYFVFTYICFLIAARQSDATEWFKNFLFKIVVSCRVVSCRIWCVMQLSFYSGLFLVASCRVVFGVGRPLLLMSRLPNWFWSIWLTCNFFQGCRYTSDIGNTAEMHSEPWDFNIYVDRLWNNLRVDGFVIHVHKF